MASLPDDVVLNIYELTAPEQPTPGSDQAEATASTNNANSSPAAAAAANAPVPAASTFLSILTPLGFGAYHTSLEVHRYSYSYAAGGGVLKTPVSNTTTPDRSAPRNAVFKERIVLGTTRLDGGQINEIINKLRTKFGPTSYHLLNRNCNHFTQTFSIALLGFDALVDQNGPTSGSSSSIGGSSIVGKYPKWVNRLARTGTSLGCLNHDDSICDVMKEARMAVGAEDRVGWSLTKSSGPEKKGEAAQSKKGRASAVEGKAGGSGKKKELTEEQRNMLAKLKKGKG